MKIIRYAFIVFIFFGCKGTVHHPKELDGEEIGKITGAMSELMIHDITNPPLAARFFSYTCLAGYQIVSQNDSTFQSLHGLIHDFPDIQIPASLSGYDYRLAAILSMLKTAGKLQPSGKELEQYLQSLLDTCRLNGYSEDMIRASEQYADSISKAILAYAKKDRYNKISSHARYTPLQQEGHWYPTPPAYLPAVEPYFNTIRPFFIDSASQFPVPPPVPYSKEKQSAFYKLAYACYRQSPDSLSRENREIALYWDCNPFAVQDDGHLQVGLKKISPGAHWIGITGLVCKQNHKTFNETMLIHTIVSMGIMDSFLACWDEKYRSNRIRPETAIRQLIDVQWKPLLQTPPFPEYLSGHSCISTTSATLLSHFIGEDVPFTDTVEMRYGLPARHFASFNEAAQEAAISRFYGGIHFTDAIQQGMVQGKKVGDWILGKLETTDLTHPLEAHKPRSKSSGNTTHG